MSRRSAALLASLLGWALAPALPALAQSADSASAPITRYFDELEAIGLIDRATGSTSALASELGQAEKLLRDGAALDAAVALYALVESPRFRDFDQSVEYQNAEYYLAVALAQAGAYGAALDYLERIVARGEAAPYFAPAHRRAVDVALETRNYAGVLERLGRATSGQSIPIEAAGEQGYLRARIAYDAGKLAEAEGELTRISRKSRLFSSALFLRGLIRTRTGNMSGAADALCEIADTPDNDTYTFVVDERYFTIKDLARLGLGRIAHEVGDYDDAYYHYFQIPDDSDRLPEALFEAAWSMYQKRELATARDLVRQLTREFPDVPLVPEARLLAGYVELADCKFDDAQKHYDELVAELAPVVAEMERIRKSADLRSALFDKALARWRQEKQAPDQRVRVVLDTPADKVLALLRLDPEFMRLHDAVAGIRRADRKSAGTTAVWRQLASRIASGKPARIAEEQSFEQDQAHRVSEVHQDVLRLTDDIARARTELRRGLRAGTIDRAEAEAENQRLVELNNRATDLAERSAAAVRAADRGISGQSQSAGLTEMVQSDLARARELEGAATRLSRQLTRAADQLAEQALERLYIDTRRVLDKAKLGKIDAVIGQKRRLEIEVGDLAAGRFPPELYGRLWQEGLIGDDEEVWPFEGEFWADEYEGWR